MMERTSHAMERTSHAKDNLRAKVVVRFSFYEFVFVVFSPLALFEGRVFG